jgi:hypothetical protein
MYPWIGLQNCAFAYTRDPMPLTENPTYLFRVRLRTIRRDGGLSTHKTFDLAAVPLETLVYTSNRA